MSWIDDEGKKYDHLWNKKTITIQTVACHFWVVEINTKDPIQISSIQFYSQQHQGNFDVKHFIDWLSERSILFRLRFRVWPGMGLRENLNAFFFTFLYNLKKSWKEKFQW